MSSKCLRGMRSDQGFTLIEVVVASAILFISIIGVMGAMTFSAQASQSSAIRNKALSLANQCLESARNMPYDSVGVLYASGGTGDPPGTILSPDTTVSAGSTFTVYTDITWIRDTAPPYRAEYKKVRVTVQWSLPAVGQVTLETGVFGNTAFLDNGDLELLVRDTDTNQPVSGAQVTVDPSKVGASTRNAWSNAQGSAFFGFIEPGTASVTVAAAGYIYDRSQLATLTIQAKMLNQMPVFVQRPSTIAVTVLDNNNVPIQDATVTVSSAKYGNRSFSTDSVGKANFSNSFIGTYTVSMSKDGYVAPPNQGAAVTSGGQTGGTAVTVNFIARASGGLNVTILNDLTDAPVSGAVVTVTGPNPLTDNAPGSPGTTGADGLESFTNMVAGNYTVNVARTGVAGTGPCYVAQTVISTVNWGVNTPLTVSLVPWGSMYIRLWTGATYKANYTLKITGPGGYSNSSLKSNSTGYLTVPYLKAGTYTIVPASKSSPSFTYAVSDGVIPSSATTLTSASW